MFLVIVLVTGCVNESYYESQNHEVDDLFEYKEVESDIVMNFIDSDSKEKDIIYISQKNKEWFSLYDGVTTELGQKDYRITLPDGKYYINSKLIGKEVIMEFDERNNKKECEYIKL